MDHNLSVLTENLLKDALLGLTVLTVTVFISAYFLIRIKTSFDQFCDRKPVATLFVMRFRVILSILQICLVQLLSIFIWASAIYSVGLVDTMRLAILFAGSCYTTMGIFSDILPPDWQSLAFYIAFSGLFSFAMATSVMITLIGGITKHSNNHAAQLQRQQHG